MTKQPAVYIIASKRNGTLYVGVTSDLQKWAWEHKNELVEAFNRNTAFTIWSIMRYTRI
jgi:putative endonuclease